MDPAPTLTLCSRADVADALRAVAIRANLDAGVESWESPPIQSLDEWLRELWILHGEGILLTPDQESLVWREIIARDAARSPLLDLDATAASAAEAWRLAHAWQWGWTSEPYESDETTAFRRWATEFGRRLQSEDPAQRWVSSAELPALPVPAAVTAIQLAGFDPEQLTPQHRALFQSLADAGVRLDFLAGSRFPATPQVATAADASAEVALAARWARQRLEEGMNGPIGVIVPDLAQRRAEVERTFAHVFHPDLAPWDTAPRAFHLACKRALSEAPVLGAALSAVRGLGEAGPDRNAGPVPLVTILELIRSPFVAASATEATARARLENELRRQRRPAWCWRDLLRLAHESCPALVRALEDALVAVNHWPRAQTHQAWVESFTAVWTALGWPGERPPDAAAVHTLHAWERLLDDFGRLDQVSPAPIPAAEALARLESCSASRPFEPPAAPAPVQVLGGLDGAGAPFNELWICGLDDETFPPSPRPNPFLPLDWQRRAGLPHASAADQSSARLWLRWRHLCASPALIASHALCAPDGHELRPSPILSGADPWTGPLPAAPSIDLPELEPLADAQAPPALASERHGPSDLLRDQSACPFRAFAHFRLHARRAPSPEPGLSAATRGSLLHRVLKALWDELGSSDRLYVNGTLRQRIARLATEILARDHALDPLPGLAAVECQRLTDTVYAWCRDIESTRAPFQVLATEEMRGDVPFAGLTFKLRRDRVDALDSGGRVLLDYKSGQVESKPWDGDRPKEPQLPLYLLTDPDPDSVVSIAFAQVRSGDMKLIEPKGGTIPRADWNRALSGLAASYLAGLAAVDPRGHDCCQHCDLHALCRIRDQA